MRKNEAFTERGILIPPILIISSQSSLSISPPVLYDSGIPAVGMPAADDGQLCPVSAPIPDNAGEVRKYGFSYLPRAPSSGRADLR